MQALTDLKAILHSKRANIYYLEKCRVMQKDGRVLYLTEAKDENHYWNIPIANTTCLLLGTGTSITQAAMRMLASAGVLVGFSGGGGTPLLMATEIEWMTPQSEYRPTEYVQAWMSFWFDQDKRLQVAKRFQQQRIEYIQKVWAKIKTYMLKAFRLRKPYSHNSSIKSSMPPLLINSSPMRWRSPKPYIESLQLPPKPTNSAVTVKPMTMPTPF